MFSYTAHRVRSKPRNEEREKREIDNYYYTFEWNNKSVLVQGKRMIYWKLSRFDWITSWYSFAISSSRSSISKEHYKLLVSISMQWIDSAVVIPSSKIPVFVFFFFATLQLADEYSKSHHRRRCKKSFMHYKPSKHFTVQRCQYAMHVHGAMVKLTSLNITSRTRTTIYISIKCLHNLVCIFQMAILWACNMWIGFGPLAVDWIVWLNRYHFWFENSCKCIIKSFNRAFG